jgi:hypothetical protein
MGRLGVNCYLKVRRCVEGWLERGVSRRESHRRRGGGTLAMSVATYDFYCFS